MDGHLAKTSEPVLPLSGSHPPSGVVPSGYPPQAFVFSHQGDDPLISFQIVGITLDVVQLDAVAPVVPHDADDLTLAGEWRIASSRRGIPYRGSSDRYLPTSFWLSEVRQV